MNKIFTSLLLSPITLSALFPNSVFTQEMNQPAHVLGVEMGMFNRGLIGASYQRLFIQKKRVLLAGGGGAGIGGVPFGGGINQFYYATASAGIGAKFIDAQFYLSAGVDLKYLNYLDGFYNASTEHYESVHYNGFGAMPFLAFNMLGEPIIAQMRVAPLFLANGVKIEKVIWGVGASVGFVLR